MITGHLYLTTTKSRNSTKRTRHVLQTDTRWWQPHWYVQIYEVLTVEKGHFYSRHLACNYPKISKLLFLYRTCCRRSSSSSWVLKLLPQDWIRPLWAIQRSIQQRTTTMPLERFVNRRRLEVVQVKQSISSSMTIMTTFMIPSLEIWLLLIRMACRSVPEFIGEVFRSHSQKSFIICWVASKARGSRILFPGSLMADASLSANQRSL